MQLHVFNGADGDCLLLESGDGHLMLIDGGRSTSFQDHVAPFLAELAHAGRELAAVCVSHIDADHITGVLKLLDYILEQRIHEFQVAHGNGHHRPPRFTMPAVGGIWHNGFEQLLGIGLATEVGHMLATTTRVLGAGESLQALVGAQAWTQSERQSAELSLQALEVLGIPINGAATSPPTLEVGGAEPDRELGSTTLTMLAPLSEDVALLRDQFQGWLDDNHSVLDDLKREARAQSTEFTASEPNHEIRRIVEPAERLAMALNNRGLVTPANLASIMLHAAEDEHAVLLTGDGHGDDVIRGLEAQGLLGEDEPLHVSVLKMPHHGAEFNIGFEEKGNYILSPFLRRITADHYVFCGDGSHHNPDRRIVKATIDSRIGAASVRSANPRAERPFKLWFTSHPSRVAGAADKSHMTGIRSYVQRRARRNRGRLQYEFLRGHRFTIEAGHAP